jgi:cytidine deaminase
MDDTLFKTIGPLIAVELGKYLKLSNWQEGWVIPFAVQKDWTTKYQLQGLTSLIKVILTAFQPPALQPISKFVVPVIGLEHETGNLLLGINLEFLGTSFGQTIHSEQFLFTRAFHRNKTITSFSLSTPTPCGHCRQFINEFAGGGDIEVSNSNIKMTIKELLPLAFGPKDLGEPGIRPTTASARNPRLRITEPVSGPVQALLSTALAAAQNSYAPYSKVPVGVAIQTLDDEMIPGSSIENAAFNPSMGGLQSGLVNLIASGRMYSEIKAVLMIQAQGKADQAPQAEALLKALAPNAPFVLISAE